MKLRHVYEKGLGREDEPAEVHVEQSFYYEEDPDNVPRFDDASVRVIFGKFGRGEKPRNYEVEVDWMEVKRLIKEFVDMKHPHAIYLKSVLSLTRSLGDHGWHNEAEPPEFWEGLIDD